MEGEPLFGGELGPKYKKSKELKKRIRKRRGIRHQRPEETVSNDTRRTGNFKEFSGKNTVTFRPKEDE